HRTALKARTAAGKLHSKERQVATMPEPQDSPGDSWRDLEPILDQELARLPDKYREAILLCDFEGQTGKEAAQHLKIPERTLATRLRAAGAKLARGLARHGLTFSAGGLAAALSEHAASASAPAVLVGSTIKTATLATAGQALAAGAIPAKV